MSNIDLDINKVYEPFITGELSGYRYYILYGGRGSGKTEATAIRLVRKCLEADYFKCLLIREFKTNVKNSNYAKIVKVIEDMGLKEHFHITTSPLEITCKLNGNTFLTGGMDNPDKIKSTENPTDLWLEEADAIKEKGFKDLDFTLRSDKDVPIEVILTFNPYDENHWIIKRFFPPKQSFEKEDGNFHQVQSTKDNCYILHTTYKDNVFAGEQYNQLMMNYKRDEPSVYKVDGLGLFGEGMKGLVYPKFKIVDEMKHGDSIIGIDYGNVNPSAVYRIDYVDGDVYIDELIYKSGLTQHQLAKAVYDLDIPLTIPIYYDAAEASLGTEFDALGLNSFPADKGAGSVVQGINFVKRFNLHVTKQSENLIKELRNYKWQSTRHGDIIDDKPVKANDHACDAIRYGIYTHGRKYDAWISGKTVSIPNITKVNKQDIPNLNFRSFSKLGNHRKSDNL